MWSQQPLHPPPSSLPTTHLRVPRFYPTPSLSRTDLEAPHLYTAASPRCGGDLLAGVKSGRRCRFLCLFRRRKEEERGAGKAERHQSVALSCSCQASSSPVSSHPAVRLREEEERGEISHQPYGPQFCQRLSTLCGQMANPYI